MRVLVTGGAGYIGSVSVEALLAAGHDAIVLDDLSTGRRAAVPAGARLRVASYGDEALVGSLLESERVDAILHCGARSLVGESVRDPARYYRDNVAGGINLLEAARRAGVSLAGVRTVPNAVRLGGRSDTVAGQSGLARQILRDHLLCVVSIAAVLVVQLAFS